MNKIKYFKFFYSYGVFYFLEFRNVKNSITLCSILRKLIQNKFRKILFLLVIIIFLFSLGKYFFIYIFSFLFNLEIRLVILIFTNLFRTSIFFPGFLACLN